MGEYGFDVDDHVDTKDDHEIFREARLDREGLEKSQWPAQIDRAALDIQYGIAVGKSGDSFDIGGEIGNFNFHWATGQYYVEGLQALAGNNSTVAEVLDEYDTDKIGKLAFRLNEFRHELEATGQSMDIDRAIEALVEKQATSAIDSSAKRGGNAGAGLRQLRDTNSVADLTLKLFSDPRVDVYAQALLDRLIDRRESDELLYLLDEPVMTTPLWEHQRRALREWVDSDQQGYVDMATATGKTVLGLAAIAYRYGRLHPADTDSKLARQNGSPDAADADRRPRVLIVAGNEILLKQWRDEFDDHLDIPKGRTEPLESEDGATIELNWGNIEFRTAQSLLQREALAGYDLAILDEAHRYSRGSQGGRRWGDLFATLTDQSDAILAMSGSIDGGWAGDAGAREALEEHLDQCIRFGVPEARDRGVIADFSWQVYYATPDTEDTQRLATQTRMTRPNYDATTGHLDTEALGIEDSNVPTPFRTYTDIRSFAQSNDGNRLRERSDQFDMFASALLARRPIRWNMSPAIEEIAPLVTRHAPAAKTVVLVQSYDEATTLGESLVTDHGFDEDLVTTLESSRDDRHEKIRAFNDRDGGVIIGPGDLLGVGVNMPDAAVAVNVARGGVNTSLVQRIGRVLRNPEGDKEAIFYHVVPQPTEADALHDVEDGAQLLRGAAEYQRLGETFKEPPAFVAADPAIEETIVGLETAGVKLLERLEDASVLVEEQGAREHVRRLQSKIYDADSGSDSRERAVITSGWAGQPTESESTTGEQSELFPERNEAYERYRLTLDPYRAIKRLATNNLGLDPEEFETEDGYRVELPDEYEGTQFHEAYERWMNEYREWRDRCDNRDGTGEPGSLPEYREHWPAPRDSEAAMMTMEGARDIGIDYAGSDPIFFPRTDDGIYEVPLPDGRRLTIDGIVAAEEPDRDDTEDEGEQYELTSVIVTVAREAVRDGEAESLDALAEAAVRDGLKTWLDDGDLPARPDLDLPAQPVVLALDEKQRKLLDMIVDDPQETFDSRAAVIEAALCAWLEVDLDGSETYSITLDRSLAIALQAVVDRDDEVDTVEEFLETTASQSILDRLDRL